MNEKLKGYILAIIASACYGLNPLFAVPLISNGTSPLLVVFYRYLLATVLLAGLLAVNALRKGKSVGAAFAVTKKECLLSLIMGILFGASSIFLFFSFLYMDAGIASTILFTYPLFVALLMMFIFHERVKLFTWISIALAMVGIYLLYHGDDGATLSVIGIALVILASLIYAFYLIGVNKSVLAKMPSLKLSFYATSAGFALIAVTLFATGEFNLFTTAFEWGCSFGLALFPTVVSIVLVTKAIHIIGSTPASIIGALEPLTALFITMVVFGGTLTMGNAVGIALILAAVILVVLKGK